MPTEARLLYYDLGMKADDDGVVEAFTVLRTTGVAKKALDALVKSGFVVVLNNDLVTYITDWKQNNFIRPDRYKASVYSDLLQRFTDGIPQVDQRYTQDSTGEDSEDKESIEYIADKPPRSRFIPPSVEEVREFCQEKNHSIDPEKFVDYYTSNGWMVGRNKMKDWKAAVRSWAKNGYSNGIQKVESPPEEPEDNQSGILYW